MFEIVLIMLLVLQMLILFGLYKYFEKKGLIFSIVILNIISFILTFKIVYVFRMNINLGIISYVSVLSVIYIYMIKYGLKGIDNLVKISLYTNIFTAILLIIMNYYIPALTETISINMEGTFVYNYKILLLFPFMMLLSQYIVIKLYSFVSKLQNNTTISIILTYIITGLVYTVIFYIICYINILSFKNAIFLGTTTYIMGLITTLLNTIFIKNLIGSKKVAK